MSLSRDPVREDLSSRINSGKKWNNGRAQAYGPTFGKGDVAGCGFYKGNVFFTKNGKFLGVAFRDVPRGLYPTMVADNCTTHANFGQAEFRYDLDWDEVRVGWGILNR